LKLDKQGCRIFCSGETIDVPAPQVSKVVDTTAAGDSFAAAYLVARSNGALPREAALMGHRLAGAVVQHRGAIIPQSAMPPAA
jgi:2-dehydro-3-deoxygluconokinase